MKAIVYTRYGSPDVLEEVDLEVPRPNAGEVLIKVRATSVNGSDWEGLTGKPFYSRIGGLFKPRHTILGSDMSGITEAVGTGVSSFQVGDEVLGNAMFKLGGFAEYACISEVDLIAKPKGISFVEAATLPQAASVALQAVRDKGETDAGKRILINGAGGTVGTFAIQIAKSMGADVTAVDAESKFNLLRELGADHLVDYTKEDFCNSDNKFDFILDVVGNRSITDLRSALTSKGIYTVAGGRILPALFFGSWVSLISKKTMGVFMWKPNRDDLSHLARLCEAGLLRPVIDKCYSLSETPHAIRAIGEGRSNGIGVVVFD